MLEQVDGFCGQTGDHGKTPSGANRGGSWEEVIFWRGEQKVVLDKGHKGCCGPPPRAPGRTEACVAPTVRRFRDEPCPSQQTGLDLMVVEARFWSQTERVSLSSLCHQ